MTLGSSIGGPVSSSQAASTVSQALRGRHGRLVEVASCFQKEIPSLAFSFARHEEALAGAGYDRIGPAEGGGRI